MSKHNTKHWVDDYEENEDEQYQYGDYDQDYDYGPEELTEE